MKKYFREVKVVTTNKDHECVVCGHNIPKGSKAINEHGRSESEGYFNGYVHLERSKNCYVDFMEVVESQSEESKTILANIIEDKPSLDITSAHS